MRRLGSSKSLRVGLLLLLSLSITAAFTLFGAHFVAGGGADRSGGDASFRARTGRSCLEHAPRLDIEPGTAWTSFWSRLSEVDCRPGTWLYQFRESGQNLGVYRAEFPEQTRVGDRLVVRRLEPFDEGPGVELVPVVAEFLSIYFQRELRLEPALPISAAAFRPDRGVRGQYDAEEVLAALVGSCSDDAAGCLALTDRDLFVRDLQYVFGLGHFRARVGVLSTYRFWDSARDPLSGEQVAVRDPEPLRRALKVAAHETSHEFGLAHCIHYRDCVMAGTNSLAESDRGQLMLCPLDHAKLEWKLDLDSHRRFRDLADFASRHGLYPEAAYWTRMSREVPALPNAAGGGGP